MSATDDQTPTAAAETGVPDSSATAITSTQTHDHIDMHDAAAAALAQAEVHHTKAAKANTEVWKIAERAGAAIKQAEKALETRNLERLQEAVAQAKEEMGRAIKASKEMETPMEQVDDAIEKMKMTFEEVRKQSKSNPGGDGA